MSVFLPGSSGAVKSTNIPAAFLELAHALDAAEKAASTPDTPINNITLTFDLAAGNVAMAATVPIRATLSSTGQVVLAASNYLGTAVAFGDGSTLKTNNYPAAFLELAQIVNAAEQAIVENPPNNVTLAFDLETQTATVTAALPINSTVDATGKIVFAATDYLP